MDICLERGADCLHIVQLMPLPSASSLASFKSRLFCLWYRLTEVVLEKKPLNRSVCAYLSHALLYGTVVSV